MEAHEHHKHVTLWIAVGVSMAVIVAFWAFGLPAQIADVQASTAKDPGRWNVAVPKSQTADGHTLLDTIDTLGDRLDTAERAITAESANSATNESDVHAKIDALSKQIEASGQDDRKQNP